MYMASKRTPRRRLASTRPAATESAARPGWRGAARRLARRPAALLLLIALVVAVAVDPSPLSFAALGIVLAYQALRAALPLPAQAWPPRS